MSTIRNTRLPLPQGSYRKYLPRRVKPKRFYPFQLHVAEALIKARVAEKSGAFFLHSSLLVGQKLFQMWQTNNHPQSNLLAGGDELTSMCKTRVSLWEELATILVLSSGAIPEILERQDIEENTPKIFQRQETTVLNNNQKKKRFPKGDNFI